MKKGNNILDNREKGRSKNEHMIKRGYNNSRMKASVRNGQIIHLKKNSNHKLPVHQVKHHRIRKLKEHDIYPFNNNQNSSKRKQEPVKAELDFITISKDAEIKLRADQLTFVPYVPKQKISEHGTNVRQFSFMNDSLQREPDLRTVPERVETSNHVTLVRKVQRRTEQPRIKRAANSASKPPAFMQKMLKKETVKKVKEPKVKSQTTAMRHLRKKELSRRRTIAVSAVAGMILTLCMIVLCGFNYTYKKVFPGVMLGSVPVGGKSVEEVEEIISGKGKSLYKDAVLVIDIDDKDYEIPVEKLIENVDAKQSAKNAYESGRKGNPFSRVFGMLGKKNAPVEAAVREDGIKQSLSEISEQALEKPVEPKWEAEGSSLVIYSGKAGRKLTNDNVEGVLTDKIRMMDFSPYKAKTKKTDVPAIDIDKIAKESIGGAANATVSKEDGRTIIKEKNGIKFDVEEARKIIGNGSKESYTIPGEVTPAKVTAEDLKTKLFRDTLATATTELNEGNEARTTNVRRAAESINGVILNPGDEFSYNDTVGERTEERGYHEAGAYSGNEVIEEYGGGVCQPSSTLYMAVLRADLEVTERENHSVTVSYTPLGEDATVSWGGPDFRFRNNTDYPIKIIAEQVDGQMIATIIGTKTTDKTVEVRTDVIETIPPESITIEVPSLTDEEIDQGGVTGYYTRTYKVITENGETKEVLANESNYSKRDEIVYVVN